MIFCRKCKTEPTLRASRPRLCWTCAKRLRLCIYCGEELDAQNELGVCPFCDPPESPGCGNHSRGSERADYQYHGSYVE